MYQICKLLCYAFSVALLQDPHLIYAQPNSGHNANSLFRGRLNFEHFSTKNGLSQNAVYAILQDQKGFLWFGTQDGLNRFNGYEFTAFHHSAFDTTSLCHSYVNGLYQDSKERLWVCTEGGLALYNPLTETFTNFLHDDTNPQSIEDNYVWTILEDSKGTLWVGTRKGLCRFDPDNKIFESVNLSSQPNVKNNPLNVQAIFEDKKGSLWIGTRNSGLFKVDNENIKPNTGSSLIATQFNIGNADVRTIVEDVGGAVCIGTFGGRLYRYSEEEKTFHSLLSGITNPIDAEPKNIRTIFYDRFLPDILWLGTEEEGIILIDTKRNESSRIEFNPLYSTSLSGNMVYAICRDRSGIYWIGTNEGINKLNLNANTFEHIQREKNKNDGLSGNLIGKIIEDHEGMLWIGTDGNGINKFDRGLNTFTRFLHKPNDPSSLSSNRAMIVFEDHAGTIWVGTFGGGLNKLNRERGTFVSYTHDQSNPHSISSNYITSIVEDKSGFLWIGTTEGGLNRFDPKSQAFKSYMNDPDAPESLSGDFIWILHIDKRDVLWAGTKSGGLNEMTDMRKGKFKRYVHNDKDIQGINHSSVHVIFEDHNGGFWIGTPGGLNLLDRETGKFLDFQQKLSFSQHRVIGILEDDHSRLWIMSEKSLIRFNPVTNELKYFDGGNGMPINDFRIWANYKNRLGEMFVGGANGFAVFHPDSLKDNQYVPPIVIDKFERFSTDDSSGYAIIEKGIPYRKTIPLSYKDNIFSFSFAALDYSNTERNQYAYKLEGFNKEWININSQKKVTFTNIDPGEYTFIVRGSNDEGVWNTQGAAVSVIISPPFWATWWFRAAVFFIVALTIGNYVRSKLKASELRHKEQEAFARQLMETEELERQRIANELHDSLGQNLLVIKNSLLVKQQQPQIEGNSLLETSELVSQTIQEVRSISHNLRPHLLDQLGLTKTIKALAKQLNDSSGIEIRAEVADLNNALEPNAEINLFRIIQESLNNIIKHSGASETSLVVKRDPQSIRISIKDNGKGMNVAEMKNRDEFGHGFGLYGMEKRAHVFNWTYEIDSSPDLGTEIRIQIPLKRVS